MSQGVEVIELVGGSCDGVTRKVHIGTLRIWAKPHDDMKCTDCGSHEISEYTWQPPGTPKPTAADLIGHELYEPSPMHEPGQPRRFLLVAGP